MGTSKFGPGFPGNTQSSPATDTPLPSRKNQGDPCFNMPEPPDIGKNAQGPAGMGEVMYGITKPGKGTSGRAVGSKIGM